MSWLALRIHVNCLLSCNHLHLERLTTTHMVDRKGVRYITIGNHKIVQQLSYISIPRRTDYSLVL